MKGNFFAININQWREACGLGMNVACLYLVMAVGSDKSNTQSRWSSHALKKYTSISRTRAKAARIILCESNLVIVHKNGNHPQYELIRPKDENPEQDLIWLPNEIVTGLETGVPPMERLRQTNDVMCLRLFIELYHAHNLVDDSGLSRACIMESYERVRFSESGPCVIWGFNRAGRSCFPKHPQISPHTRKLSKKERDEGHNNSIDLFKRIEHISGVGLLDFVPYLCEGDNPNSEVIYPLIDGLTGDETLSIASSEAALSMLGDAYQYQAEDYDHLVPVLRHIENVQVVGIGILRYRPKTELTAAGYAINQEKIKHWKQVYQDLVDSPASLSNNSIATQANLQYQGNIKEASR